MLSVGVLALLLATTGCSEEAGNISTAEESIDENVMTFAISHPADRKVQTRATDTAFETDDRIGVFISESDSPLEVSGNYVNNAALTYDGAQWTPDKTIYWNDGTYNIYSYYPYTVPVSSVDEMPFTVSTDQNSTAIGASMDGYEVSDFLWATAMGVTGGNGAVPLQFRHCMSRILIKLVKGEDYEGDELPDDAEVYIHSTVPSATIDMSVGIVTRNPYGTAQTIRAKDLGNQMYAAIIVPQRLDNRQPLVEVIMKGVSYLYESKFQFKPGIQHSVQLAISKDPGQIKIEIGGEMEDWSETEE